MFFIAVKNSEKVKMKNEKVQFGFGQLFDDSNIFRKVARWSVSNRVDNFASAAWAVFRFASCPFSSPVAQRT
jgi:hypothetical protein